MRELKVYININLVGLLSEDNDIWSFQYDPEWLDNSGSYALQAIKPLLVIFIYKEITNFHPTIVNNYEIYKMVVEHIYHGSMKSIYTLAFIISEILFLSAPIVLYKRLSSRKA